MFENELAGINALYDFIVALPELLCQVAIGVLMTFAYPVVWIINIVYNLIGSVYGIVTGLLNIIIALPNNFGHLFDVLFTGVMPSAWVVLFGLSVVLRLLMRVYQMLKGVTIAGFSI